MGLAVSDEVRVSHCFILAQVTFEDVVNVDVEMPSHVRFPDCHVATHWTFPLLFLAMAQAVLMIILATSGHKVAFVARVHFDRSTGRSAFLGG